MDYTLNLDKYESFVRSESRLMVDHVPTSSEIEVLALSNALGGECGELQNVVKKMISKNQFLGSNLVALELNDKFVEEAGDTLWYLVRLIHKSGYNVKDIMDFNIKKLTERYKEGDTWRK